VRFGLDFGTSNTVGVVQRPDGGTMPLLVDSSPLQSSAVHIGPDGALLTGADAERAALAYPAGLEPNPKRRVDDGTVWLGERELGVADIIAAVLSRQWSEACRIAGGPVEVVLTHPAAWGRPRLAVLGEAARRAGLAVVGYVAEPVAAAAYFATILGHDLPPGRALVVYDLGAGTFDVSAVRRTAGGFEAFASAGLNDVGGLDLDAAVVDHLRSLTAHAATAWGRLDWPQTGADQRARRDLWQGARAAKELLSRHSRADVHIPLVDLDLHITREEFEKAARPSLDRTVAVTLEVVRSAGVAPEQVAGVFLVGGSSRIPLVATLLHRHLRIAPTVIDQPELVVAHGCLRTWVPWPPVAPAPRMPPPGLPIQAPAQPRPPHPPVAAPQAPAAAPHPPAAAPRAPVAAPHPPATAPRAPVMPSPAVPPAVGGIPPRGVLSRDFPVQLVELALGERIGYTVRTFVTDDDGSTAAVFASAAGRLPLFPRPEQATEFAAGSEGHAMCAVLHWDTLSEWMARAFLPLAEDNRYDLDLPAVYLELEPREWRPGPTVKAGVIARQLTHALEIDEGHWLLGQGTRLDQLDDALRLAQRQPLRRHRRGWLAFDRNLLAGQWRRVAEVIDSHVDWRD
jgi:Hsp70 protein